MHETECCKSWLVEAKERLGYAIDCAHVTFIAARGGAWEQGYTPLTLTLTHTHSPHTFIPTHPYIYLYIYATLPYPTHTHKHTIHTCTSSHTHSHHLTDELRWSHDLTNLFLMTSGPLYKRNSLTPRIQNRCNIAVSEDE